MSLMATNHRAGASPLHHPVEDLLFAYATGELSESSSLAVATHLALCPLCREEVRRMEAIGGALLEHAPQASVDDGMLNTIFAMIDDPETAPPEKAPLKQVPLATASSALPDGPTTMPVLPEPLRSYVGGDLDKIQWSRVIRGVDEAMIPCQGGKARLLRIKAGMTMPRHTHTGSELTLVLSGAFADECGHYKRGDFAGTDGSVDHRPIADPGPDCICLAVTDAPLRLTGPLGRLLNPFVTF